MSEKVQEENKSIFPNLSDNKCKTMIANFNQMREQVISEISRRRKFQVDYSQFSTDELFGFLEELLRKEQPLQTS